MSVHRQWQFDEDAKADVHIGSESNGDYSDGLATGVRGSGEGDDYGEVEVVIKFKGRTGPSTSSSRTFRLTSEHVSVPTATKVELSTDGVPRGSHRVYLPPSAQRFCLIDKDAGCACNEFSSPITQPKKQPRLSQAEGADAQESNDGEDNGERHTCPYFKMYPERHLECGTKDLAQRPKIKSHIIKDHLKKSGIPIPPEIKSQKCEPWDRWCKWIVQDSSKADRPVPNSNPDFYPILNYIVTAASEIPSDGLTCFSSVMLRLFRAVQEKPGEWNPFINGLESLEQSLNNVGATLTDGIELLHRTPLAEPEAGDGIVVETDEANCHQDQARLDMGMPLSNHCDDIPALSHYSAESVPEALPVSQQAFAMSAHSTSYGDLHEQSHSHLPGDFGRHPDPLDPNIFREFIFPQWIEMAPQSQGLEYNMMADPNMPHEEQLITSPVHDHTIVSGPRKISVTSSSTGEEQCYEYSGDIQMSDFLEWLRVRFDFSLDKNDGRKLWCVDSREDILVHAADTIKAHLKSLSTKGSSSPEMATFRINTSSDRAFGGERYSNFTPAYVDDMMQDESIEQGRHILSSRPSSHHTYR
ncbi:hypothetical protein ABW21_db0207962 [Orbilia brochopaga]|nr:hypothetical protein ABW21_db0207962 [Drechslerella brochopaga]